MAGGSQLLRTILPSAINWGVNKLVTSNFGQKYVNPFLMNAVSSIQAQNQTPSNKEDLPVVTEKKVSF